MSVLFNDLIYSDETYELLTGVLPASDKKTYELHENTKMIGPKAFFNKAKLETLKLPENVKIIKAQAFAFCISLKEIEFNEGLETIGARAFSHCTSLDKINLPNTLIAINQSAFSLVPIEKLTLPESLFYMEDEAFMYCPIKELEFSCSCDVIPSKCFYQSKIETLDLSSSKVSTIGPLAFAGCVNLRKVILSNCIKVIDKTTFEDCDVKEFSMRTSSIAKMIDLSKIDIVQQNLLNLLEAQKCTIKQMNEIMLGQNENN